jgi:hypothetical protein
MEAKAKSVVSVSLAAVIIRKDGTRQDLGKIAYWHRNPLRRLLWWAKEKTK